MHDIDVGCQGPWKLTCSKSPFSDLSNPQHCESLRLLKNFYPVLYIFRAEVSLAIFQF